MWYLKPREEKPIKKIIKLKNHNNTIYNNPLIYIILLERSKKFFRMPSFASTSR